MIWAWPIGVLYGKRGGKAWQACRTARPMNEETTMDEEETMMDEHYEAHSVTIVSVFLLGAMVGAGIALLAAPEAGMRTRRRIRRVAGELRNSAHDHWDDLATDVKDRESCRPPLPESCGPAPAPRRCG